LGLLSAHVAQSDDVRVLGVQLSSDLSLDKHVNVVSAKCFFQLRQLRRIRRSLDDDSVAAIVHALIGIGTGGGGLGPLTFFFEGAQYARGPPPFEKCCPIFELKVTPYFQS